VTADSTRNLTKKKSVKPVAGPLTRPSKKTDRRILRTRNVLGDALIALMQKKPFEDITVQQVLDRAGVGRSTFYAHYRGTEDLFISDVEDFFELFTTALKRHGDRSNRLVPVREFCAHLRESRQLYAALTASGKMNDVRTLGIGYFARSIEENLKSGRTGMAIPQMEAVQRAARAHALAGSLFSLLDWWIDKGMKLDPQEVDDLFHRMAWKGLQER
jgi:AcrR family transcriptional regulator